MKKTIWAYVLFIAALALAGCGGQQATPELVMDEPVPPGAEDAVVVELEFTADEIIPKEVTIPANTKVLFVIYNSDDKAGDLNEDHNLVAPDVGLKEIVVVPGQTVRRLWDGYGTPGQYRLGCTIHSWIDMTLIVK